MGTAYTPGLLVAERTIVRKQRRLPIKGEVLVKVGDKVEPSTIVARALRPGVVHTVKVADTLGVDAAEVERFLLKKMGDSVAEKEVIAQSKSFFGLFTANCLSPVAGTVEFVSTTTGHVGVRAAPLPIQVAAYISGTAVEVMEAEGAVIETVGALVQGIFGIGGERQGKLQMVASRPDEVMTPDSLSNHLAGNILVGGSLFTLDAVKKAIAEGASAVVAGGIMDGDIKQLLGYDIGVAITGQEGLGTTVVVTEGFGEIDMAERTFALLKSLDGKDASISGATQIRAGVIRPEIVVPEAGAVAEEVPKREGTGILEIGTPVRIIREPYFGELATVTALPEAPLVIDTGAKVRVLKAKLRDGREVTVPRANVEIIEG